MKKIKNLLPFMLILISSSVVFAQKPLPDTIHVQIDSTMELELALNASKDLNGYIESDLKSLQSILDKSGVALPEMPYTITYVPDDVISVKPSGQKETVIWKDNEIAVNQFNNQCIVNAENYWLLIRFNDLKNLTSDSLITKINEAVDSTGANQGRFAATYNYAFEGNSLDHLENLDKLNGQMDMLSLNGGVGVNLIKNQPVIDISAKVGLLFSKKGVLKNNFYLSYNSLSYFNDLSQFKLNGIANIGYRYNFSNDAESPNWLGVEFGYLVNRNGDLFDKNTFRFGINWELGNNVSVSPQYYFSGKESYPAIRIGFGF